MNCDFQKETKLPELKGEGSAWSEICVSITVNLNYELLHILQEIFDKSGDIFTPIKKHPFYNSK